MPFLKSLFGTVTLLASLVSAQNVNATNSTGATGPITVSNTILVFARDSASGYSATSGFNGHGIPYQLVIVPQAGISLPTLNTSATQGNYGGIVVLSEVAYDYSTGWASALTTDQWNQLFNYQTAFGVRMVRLDIYPTSDFGTTAAINGTGCCNAGVEQLISFSNTNAFPTAGLNSGAGVSTQGLWHYPAVITNSTIATEIAQFAASADGSFSTTSTAAVINNINGRQQMVFFTSWATDWSATSNFLQHAYIQWVTRGMFVGRRRIYLGTQIDDMHLVTDLYQPNGSSFRIRPADLDAHVTWQANLNSRLPAGSSYFIEIGHNGNGDIEAAVDANGPCNPDTGIEYPDQIDTALEFQKPLGTGTDIWPSTPTNYTWSAQCAAADALASWFETSTNRDAFAHISHTFTHEALNNATYSDAYKEIQFNVAWMKQVGIYNASRFSPNGIIPPAITGLHNGDAIRAWMDQGITYVVGDNTRPVLLNTQNEYWPLISTVAGNGYAGLTILPRWATTIYYNCDLPDCTTQEWINTSAGSGNFTNLLNDARETNTRHLFALHHDPFMFHQANLRQDDVTEFTVGTQSGKLSLLMIWVETVVQEYTRLVNWPVLTLKHDDLGVLFTNRMTRDQCGYNLVYQYSNDGKSIVGATLTANGNTCGSPIPVTFPVGASTTASGTTSEQIGSDPLTIWAPLNGSPVTFTLSTPIPL